MGTYLQYKLYFVIWEEKGQSRNLPLLTGRFKWHILWKELTKPSFEGYLSPFTSGWSGLPHKAAHNFRVIVHYEWWPLDLCRVMALVLWQMTFVSIEACTYEMRIVTAGLMQWTNRIRCIKLLYKILLPLCAPFREPTKLGQSLLDFCHPFNLMKNFKLHNKAVQTTWFKPKGPAKEILLS